MGKASRTKRAGTARERIAAQRAAARRAEIRNRVFLASGALVVVIGIVVAFVLVKANAKPKSGGASNGPTGTALASVVDKVTSVPPATLETVGPGTVKAVYDIDLPRPRGAVQEIRFEPRFLELHQEIWESLRDEVERAYARTAGERA